MYQNHGPQRDYMFLILGVASTFFAIIFVTVMLPQLTFRPEANEWAVEYTEQELRGREIYKREGCWYCHTQFVRPQDRGLGPVAQPGDYAKQNFVMLGTARTGPDLSLIGGKFPNQWHHEHHRNPRAFVPGSVMPSFSYLSNEELEDLAIYLQTLGREKVKRLANEDFDVPDEYKYDKERKPRKNPLKNEMRFIVNGRGVFNTKCAACHGIEGKGNGPRALGMVKRPANFTLPQFKTYSDAKFFWRISEGIPGTEMPRWGGLLSEEQRWYLVLYVRFLADGKRYPPSGEPGDLPLINVAYKDHPNNQPPAKLTSDILPEKPSQKVAEPTK